MLGFHPKRCWDSLFPIKSWEMNLIAFDVGAQLQASNQYPSALGSLYFQLPGAAQRTYNHSLKEKLEYLHYIALPSKKSPVFLCLDIPVYLTKYFILTMTHF